MRLRMLVAALLLGGSSSAAWAQESVFLASFHDISDASFRVEAIAPPDVVSEYALCKAVWLAEHKKVDRIALGRPGYGEAKAPPAYPYPVPADWVALTAMVYLDPLPADAFPVDVPMAAQDCRKAWDWYR